MRFMEVKRLAQASVSDLGFFTILPVSFLLQNSGETVTQEARPWQCTCVCPMLGLCTVCSSKQRTANQGLQLLFEAKEFLFVFVPFFFYHLLLTFVVHMCVVSYGS